MQDGHSESPGEVRSEAPRASNYTRVRLIAEGGYGEVWLACSAEGEYRAMKVISRKRFADENAFNWELHDVPKFEPISLSHEGLVDILQVGRNEAQGVLYYVMELADDRAGAPQGADSFNPDTYQPRTLHHDLNKYGALSLNDCLPIALNLTDALGSLHQQGFVHPDTSSANIVFVNGVAKLTKIGRSPDSGNITFVTATDGFIPPEGLGTVQTDIYSLGKVFYEMVTGKQAHQFPEWPVGPNDRPEMKRWRAIISKACDPNPNNRYSNCAALHAALLSVQNVSAPKETPWMKIAAILAIVGIALGALAWWKKDLFSKKPQPAPVTVATPHPEPAGQPQAQPAPEPVARPIAQPAVQPRPKPAAVAQQLPPFRVGKTLFTDSFDSNSAENWFTHYTSDDTEAQFGYDYSAMGIPPAPGSSGTVGLRMAANFLAPKSKEAVNVSPKRQTFRGNYRLKLNLWMNVNGPFPQGGLGSTQYFLTGVGTSGNRVHGFKEAGANDDGIWFATDGDGDGIRAVDFTAYKGLKLMMTNSGVYAAGFDDFARASQHPYYAKVFRGGQKIPSVQASRYPSTQKGTLFPGALGMAWRTVEVVKLDNKVFWSIDGLLIATVDINAASFSTGIFIGYADSIDSIATQPELCFAVVDNLVIEEISP
jgi:serine/threonine protein kinase